MGVLATYHIHDHSQIVGVIGYLNSNFSSAVADGKPLVVRISDKQDDRTVAQNRLYWLWLTQWAKHQGTTKEHEHFFFKYKYLISIYQRDDQQFAEMCHAIRIVKKELGETEQYKAIRDGVIRETSTTKATVKQMTEYLNRIHDFCLKHGCKLIIPDELKWCYDGER